MDPMIQLANELFEDEENIFDSFAMLYNSSSHLGLPNSNVQDSVGSITAVTNQVQTTESYENPVVPPLELDVPNPLSQSPIASDPLWNGTLENVVGGFISEGAASSIQGQHMAPTGCYNPFYQSETQNSHMFQGSTIPNEYTTSNQLFEPNFTASNAFNAMNQHSSSQTALFPQYPVEGAGAGFGIGISSTGQFMSNQSSMFSPLQNDHFISPPTRAQHNQFSAVNAYDSQYAPNYKHYDSNAYHSQYTPNYKQYDSSASYRPTQVFTTPLHEASRPCEMQMAFDSQSQQFMQPISPSNPRHTYPNHPQSLFTRPLHEASHPSEMQMAFDSQSQQFIQPISPSNPWHTYQNHPHSQQFATTYNSFATESSVPPRPSAMGPPIQQGAPISGNTITGQRDKAPIQSSSFGAQPSQSVHNMLIQNGFPIPVSGPSMLQRDASTAGYEADSSDEIIENRVYDKKYIETGQPLDPHLRSLLASRAKSDPSYFPQ